MQETNTTPASANLVPSYPAPPEPNRYAPPWIQTMTGSDRARGSGVHTLTVSHSPVVSCGGETAPGVPGKAACGAWGPNATASRTPSQRFGRTGAWNLRCPSGG